MYPPEGCESFPRYYLWTVCNILVGAILGWVVERVALSLQAAFGYGPLLSILIQLSLSILVLYLVMRLTRRYVPRWHDSRPGVAWVFFIVQYSFFTNLFLVGRSLGTAGDQRVVADEKGTYLGV
jgi:uncharacterized membrane protein YhaH (DUF805 family)